MFPPRAALLALVCCLLSVPPARAEDFPKDPAPGPQPAYDVSCPPGVTQAEKCAVGKDTYVGWRSFHAHCAQCHGGSAMGSTFAPNLGDRVQQHVDWARFSHVLQHGYTGKVGAMPAFARNTAVMKDRAAIYGYLMARAAGVLPPGRPVRKP